MRDDIKNNYYQIAFFFLVLCLSFCSCKVNHGSKELTPTHHNIVSSDLANFWRSYDAIHAIEDSIEQIKILNKEFLAKASLGQKRMISARNYSSEEYLNSMLSYPKFWNSLRHNTENLDPYKKDLLSGENLLKKIYPDLVKSTMYFTMGAHRSPGTGVDSFVLIGTEFALGDLNTNTSEFEQRLKEYYEINPVSKLQFLTVHEYVHTQQKPMVHNLLSLALYEGIAEFVAHVATNQESPWRAFSYGPLNSEKVKARFKRDMFRSNVVSTWLWNNSDNVFGTSELGYYVGYTIAELHYNKATDKKLAIKELIELDFENEKSVESIVDGSGYFGESLENLYQTYEDSRPRITKIEALENQSSQVDPDLSIITLQFSESMEDDKRGFDYGPLGEDHVLRVQKVLGLSDDGMSFSFVVKLEPNKRYQSLVTSKFISKKGFPLKPFLIDFTTRSK